MTRRLRRGGAALLMLALVPGLSACGDFDPATNLVRPDNAAGESPTEDVVARAVVLVKSPNAAASALAGTLINRGEKPDTLDTIEIVPDDGAAPITLKPALTINPGQVIAMGTEAQQPLTVQDNGALKVGHFADVTMRFRTAGDVRMEVPVEVRDRYYSAIVPATGAGTTATQADRRLANCAVTNTKAPATATAKANAACASAAPQAATPQAARQEARAAARKAASSAATTGTTGAGATTGTTGAGTTGTGTTGTGTTGTAATSKAGSGALPAAKKPVAKAPQQAGTQTTQQPAAPTGQAPAAGPAADGHAPGGH